MMRQKRQLAVASVMACKSLSDGECGQAHGLLGHWEVILGTPFRRTCRRAGEGARATQTLVEAN